MSAIYKLTCSCGKNYPIETSKSGQIIQCSCGNKLAVPSMLKMKKLPLWDEEASSSTASEDSAPSQADKHKNESQDIPQNPAEKKDSSASKISKSQSSIFPETAEKKQNSKSAASSKKARVSNGFSGTRKGILVVGILLSLFFGFLFYRTAANPPRPINVLTIQRSFWDGSRVINRDSNPITEDDIGFFVTEDNLVINDYVIEQFNPFFAYKYFDHIKCGLSLSDNFADKYESLVIRYRLMSALYGLLIIAVLSLSALFFFILKKKRVVGTMQGVEWKK